MSSLYCKTCLSTCDEMVTFDTPLLADLLFQFTSIQANATTEYLCKTCAIFILQMSSFREKALEIDKILMKCKLQSFGGVCFVEKAEDVYTLTYTKEQLEDHTIMEKATFALSKMPIVDTLQKGIISEDLSVSKEIPEHNNSNDLEKNEDEIEDIEHDTNKITDENEQDNEKRASYTCHKCSRCFSIWFNFVTHLQTKHKVLEGNTVLSTYCQACHLTFQTSDEFYEHAQKFNHERAFKCQRCTETFWSEQCLDYHISNVCSAKRTAALLYPGKEGQCELCGKHMLRLRSHMRHVHFPRKPPVDKCTECGERFNKRKDMTQHMMRKHNITTDDYTVCSYCGKSILLNGLRNHVQRSHVSDCQDKKLTCRYCKRQDFVNLSLLREHQRQEHAEDRKNVQRKCACEQCGKSFRNKSNLQNHIVAAHKDIRPFACTYCSKTYKQKVHLSVHMRSHTNETPYVCDICGNAFTRWETLTKHFRSHKNSYPEMKCSYCDKLLDNPYSLKAHLVNEHNVTDCKLIVTEQITCEETNLEYVQQKE